MIEKLARALTTLQSDVTFDELRDVLWLAQFLPPASESTVGPQEAARETTDRSTSDARAKTAASTRRPPAPTPPMTQREVAAEDNAQAYAFDGKSELPIGDAVSRVGLRGPDALPDSLGLARALRPIGRRRRFGLQVVLDELATVERIAETGLALPVFRARRQRWFDVILLVEQSASLVAWRPQVRAFEALLQRQGGFRGVQTFALWAGDTVRASTLSGTDVPASSLIGQPGRRVIIVVSDCTSTAWHDGSVGEWLQPLTAKLPMAVAQPFNRQSWQHTALGFVELNVSALVPGGPLADLRVRRPRWADGKPGLVLPVFEMEAASAGAWARMLMATGDAWSAAALVPRKSSTKSDPIDAELEEALAQVLALQEPDDDAGLLEAFRGAARPAARRLASGLAVVSPLTLPVMRLVQRTLAPEGGAAALAQVLSSGLFRPSQTLRPDNENRVTFGLSPLARTKLQTGLSRSQWQQVMLAIGHAIELETGEGVDIMAWIDDPHGTDRLPPAARPFAEFARKVAERFRGTRDIDSERGGYRWLKEVAVGAGLSVRATRRVSVEVLRLLYSPDGTNIAVRHGVGVDIFQHDGVPTASDPASGPSFLVDRIRRTSRPTLVLSFDDGDRAVRELVEAFVATMESVTRSPVETKTEPIEFSLMDENPGQPSEANPHGAQHVMFLTRDHVSSSVDERRRLAHRLRTMQDKLRWIFVPLDSEALSVMPDRAHHLWVDTLRRPLNHSGTREVIDSLVSRLSTRKFGDPGEVGAMGWLQGPTERLMHVERLADTPWVLQWPREHGTLEVPVPVDDIRGGDGCNNAMAVIGPEGDVWLSPLAWRSEQFQYVDGTMDVRTVRFSPDGRYFAALAANGQVRVHAVDSAIENA